MSGIILYQCITNFLELVDPLDDVAKKVPQVNRIAASLNSPLFQRTQLLFVFNNLDDVFKYLFLVCIQCIDVVFIFIAKVV